MGRVGFSQRAADSPAFRSELALRDVFDPSLGFDFDNTVLGYHFGVPEHKCQRAAVRKITPNPTAEQAGDPIADRDA